MLSKEKQFLAKTLFLSGELALVISATEESFFIFIQKKIAIFLLTFAGDSINSPFVTKVTRRD